MNAKEKLFRRRPGTNTLDNVEIGQKTEKEREREREREKEIKCQSVREKGSFR